jgi:hypothetical protein
MWNWLRRKPAWESPIGDPERVDIIGARRDGGVDLCLVVSRPLDLSPETVEVFCCKLRNYCRYVRSPHFAEEFGPPSEERVRLIVSSKWEVPRELIDLMAHIRAEEEAPVDLVVEYE